MHSDAQEITVPSPACEGDAPQENETAGPSNLTGPAPDGAFEDPLASSLPVFIPPQSVPLTPRLTLRTLASPTIIRPNQPVNNQVSMLRLPGQYQIESIYTPTRGLKFFVHINGPTNYESLEFSGYTPVPWLEAYAREGIIRLSSWVEEYRTIEELAESIRMFIHSYFDCDPLFESVSVLFVLHTWVYERFQAVPYLRFLGLPGTGKSRGTETIGTLCYHALTIAGSMTAAPMFRMIDAIGGTVLFDEADFQDTEVGADAVKILNCGYQKRLPVTRMEKDEAGNFVPRLFDIFGPKIINGRKRFKDEAVETRCLACTPTATVRPDLPVQLPDAFYTAAEHIRNQLLKFRLDRLDSLQPNTERIVQISSRMNQIIQPLLTICDLMAETVGQRYRTNLLQFVQAADQETREIGFETVEAAIVRVLSEFDQRGEQPTCKQISDAVIYAERENVPGIENWLKPRKLGDMVRELGFRTKHTLRGAVVILERERLAGLERKYGVTRSERPAGRTRAAPLPRNPPDE